MPAIDIDKLLKGIGPRTALEESGLMQLVIPIKYIVCFHCLENTPKLSHFASYLRVSYCSKACQSVDWKSGGHKAFCKVFVALNNQKEKVSTDGRTWAGFEKEKV